MTSLATRRRRRRRIAVAAGFAVLLAVLAVVGTLWRRSVQETRRAEAAKLLALGQLRLADHPNAALAYAIASLERADNEGARRFAVEALWQGPPALFLQGPNPWSVGWSPDDRWLALGGSEGVEVLERETGAARRISSTLERMVGFPSDGGRLVTMPDRTPRSLHVWALPEGRLERTFDAEGASPVLVDDRLLTFAFADPTPDGRRFRLVRELPLDGAPETAVGVWESNGLVDWDIDPTATWILSLQGGHLVQQRLDDLSALGRLIGTHEGKATVWVRPWRDRAVTGDSTGEIRIWDVPSARLERTLRSPREATWIALDPRERYVAAAPGSANQESPPWLFLFDLAAPRAVAPAALRPGGVNVLNDMRFSADGAWLATVHNGDAILWNMAGTRPTVLGQQQHPYINVSFTPDGGLLAASLDGVVRRWTLSRAGADDVRELFSGAGDGVLGIGPLDPGGRFVVVAQAGSEIIVVPLDGSPTSSYRLASPQGTTVLPMGMSLDPAARVLAISTYSFGHPELNAIRILNLSTGDDRTLDTHPEGAGQCEEPGSNSSGFAKPVWLPDGRLVSDGDGGLRLWDLATGTSRQLRACREMQPSGALWLLATPDSRTVVRLDGVIQVAEASSLSAFDLVTHETREITSHGNRLCAINLDATGTILVSGSFDGVVRVGLLHGGEPHLLFGHTNSVESVAVSPDGRTIASAGGDGTIRLWPMPDLSKPPLHTLPHDELLAKLHSLTNLRAVRDPASDTGWTIEVGPFPGWATVPSW